MSLKPNARHPGAVRKPQLCFFLGKIDLFLKKGDMGKKKKKTFFSFYIFEGLDMLPGTSPVLLPQSEDGMESTDGPAENCREREPCSVILGTSPTFSLKDKDFLLFNKITSGFILLAAKGLNFKGQSFQIFGSFRERVL